MTASRLSKDECYESIGVITGRSRERAHMAQMGISDCIKIIRAFCTPDELIISR
jgi:hypothetical protein